MKVILFKDVKGVGERDDVIEVNPGYANNYLIKNNLAVLYTKKSREVLEESIAFKNEEEEKEIKKCEELKNKIMLKKYIFYLKTNKDQTFGSISSKQIYEKLKENGFNIDKKYIHLKENLSSLGHHFIEIELHKKVKFDLDIEIKKQN